MKDILLIAIIALTTLTAEVINIYHPPKEPKGLYLVDIEIGDSYSVQKKYRIYCPTAKVRDISSNKWDKARDVQDEDRDKKANGNIIAAYNQTCNKNLLHTTSTARNNVTQYIDEASVKKKFLIALSTKRYNDAKIFARKLSHKSNIALNLRGLDYNQKIGLSSSIDKCLNDAFQYPCYIARGRYDDGIYISIEYSSSYNNFTTGYYIVVVASGDKIDKALPMIRGIAKDAYIKSSDVYMGCIH